MMRRNMTCRIVLFCTIIALLLGTISAAADSPVGVWTGSFNGAGKNGGASATFSSDGGVTLSALGISASGSYGGSSIQVSSLGISLTLSYSVRGDRMTISGRKGKYHGSMSLNRVGVVDRSEEMMEGEDSPEVIEMKKALSGQWTTDVDGIMYEVSFYSDGFLSWVETPLADNVGASEEYGACFNVSSGKLILKPLDETEDMPVPVLWPMINEGSGRGWEFSYEVTGNELKLSEGEGDVLTLYYTKDVDSTPAEKLFRPYITLKLGMQGEAIRQMQVALITAGYLKRSADGVFGAMTEKAVKAFQKANGLEADGITTKDVFASLYR